MNLDAKTAIHILIKMAEKIDGEIELYQGCAGITPELDAAMNSYKEAVDALRTEFGEAFGG